MNGDNLRDAIEAAVSAIRLPAAPVWLVPPGQRILEYAAGPVIDHPGRFPWWGLLAAVSIAAVVYRVRCSRDHGFLAFCFPRTVYRHPSALVDLRIGFMNFVAFGGGALNVTWRLTGALVASWITILLTAAFGVRGQPQPWGPVAIALFTLALSMASDFGYFLFHWASHRFPPLWAIHKLHHSAEVLTPLTAARVHPLEKAIMGPFIALTTGLAIGPVIYLYAGATGMPAIFGMDLFSVLFFMLGHHLHHSHVWVSFGPLIGRVIVSPAQHQIHHSSLPHHIDRNFAEHWAIWDTLFGTLYLPNGQEHLKLGLAGNSEQPHRGVSAAWLLPVWEAGFALARAASACAVRLGGRPDGIVSLCSGARPGPIPRIRPAPGGDTTPSARPGFGEPADTHPP